MSERVTSGRTGRDVGVGDAVWSAAVREPTCGGGRRMMEPLR